MPSRRRPPKSKPNLTHHIKHWLVPHAANGHRPHLIRVPGLALMAVLTLGVQATAIATRPAAVRATTAGHVLAYATDITVNDLFTQTNQQRAANGLAPLHLSAQLNYSAELKAQDMFAEDYWAHVSPSGIQPWYWFGKAGYNYSYAGENLAKDFDTTSGVMAGWMNSPPHRANILDANYTDVGFAVENGTLVGGQTTLVVEHFGAPATLSIAATVAPHTTPRPAAATRVPTPAPTSFATPTPSPSPVPVVAAANPPTPSGQITNGTPPPKSYSLFAPLSLARTLNWGTLVTIGLLLLLLGVYTFAHAAVWRKDLTRWRRLHYRLYAAGTISGLVVAILVLAVSGFGQVG